ncbi:hypothetical protein SDC9_83171 [bioreactor metagenome]|uniref:Uncharacterized protein n=1 Tax=bioreactor metagenome TaxID=1076179 RepID=A0A644Z6Y7_9ZZZZ
MVADMQPVTNLHAVPIDRERLALHAIMNHERNEFFRKLVGPIVVGAARDVQRQAEGFRIRAADQIRTRLRGGIRTVGRKRHGFAKLALFAKRAVNLVGGHLQKLYAGTESAAVFILRRQFPVLFCCV